MTKTRTLISALATLAAAAFFFGCGQKDPNIPIQTGQIIGGGTVQVAGVKPVGGFLPYPSLLQPGGNGRPDLYYLNPTFSGPAYKSIILDPVTIWTGSNSQLNSVPSQQRQVLADQFHAALAQALGQKCQLVTESRPGTMRIRIALVDAVSTDATINTVATYMPYVSAVNAAAAVGFNNGVGYFAGSATAEGYILDATTGALLWEGVDKRGGTTSAAENTLNTWLDVQHAFQAWSGMFVQRLTDLKAC
jgi:hypothetical protein